MISDDFDRLAPDHNVGHILPTSIEKAVADFKTFYSDWNKARFTHAVELTYLIINQQQYEQIHTKWLQKEKEVHIRLFRSIQENDLC